MFEKEDSSRGFLTWWRLTGSWWGLCKKNRVGPNGRRGRSEKDLVSFFFFFFDLFCLIFKWRIINHYVYKDHICWPTVVKNNSKASFLIATSPRCSGGQDYICWIEPLTLDLYLIMLSSIKFHLWVFGMGQPIGIMLRVFPNGPGDRGSIVNQVISKTQKMILDVSLLN